MKLFVNRIRFISSLIYLSLLFLVACSDNNEYEAILKEYVGKDLIDNSNRRDYEIAYIKTLAEEQPMEFEVMYKEALEINTLVSKFENYLLKANNIDSLNNELKNFRESIFKLNLDEYQFLEKGLDVEKITSLPEKYRLINRLKNLNFDRYNSMLIRVCDLSVISSYKPKILASRLNDSIVVLNIYSRFLRDISVSEPSLDVTINKNVSAETFAGFDIKPNNSSAAYVIKSKSDTLFVDAVIKTDNISKRIISKNSSYINVGDFKEFDENYLEDYFKEIYN